MNNPYDQTLCVQGHYSRQNIFFHFPYICKGYNNAPLDFHLNSKKVQIDPHFTVHCSVGNTILIPVEEQNMLNTVLSAIIATSQQFVFTVSRNSMTSSKNYLISDFCSTHNEKTCTFAQFY